MSSYHSAPSPGIWPSDAQAGPSSSRPSPLPPHSHASSPYSGAPSSQRASPRKAGTTPPDAMEQFYDAEEDEALKGFGVLGLGPPPTQTQEYSPGSYHTPLLLPLDDPPSKPSPSSSHQTRSSSKPQTFSPGYSPAIPARSPGSSIQSVSHRSPYPSAEFNAYPPETSPGAHIGTPHRSHFAPYGSMSSPNRERLASSTSVGSMSSTLRGNRAPAPAALDLSPRRREAAASTMGSAAREKYGSIEGLMPPGEFGDFGARRNVSDSSAWSRLNSRDPRPLPQPPHSTSDMNLAGVPRYQPPPGLPPGAYPTREHSRWPTASPSSSINVPLSAVGGHARVASAAPVDRLSVRNDEPRASIDSYYLSPTPQSPNGASPVVTPSFSPVSPEGLDPANIDRRNLVGVGELSTPRWGASPATHNRIPSIPGAFEPPAVPLSIPSTSVPTRGWATGQSGLGLGMGVGLGGQLGRMEDVKEESSQRDNRPRHRSVSHTTPPRPNPPVSAPPTTDLLGLGQLADFDFDSTMTAALAASLGMPEDKISPPRAAAREHRISAPPPQTASAPPLPELRSQQIQQGPFQAKVSPGSARSRIYARRASRQAMFEQEDQSASGTAPISPIYSKFTTSPATAQRTDQSFRQSSVPPLLDMPSTDESPKASKFVEEPHMAPRQASRRTPPSSADSSAPLPPGALRARKSGSSKSGDGTPKSRQSPSSTSHHDIMKHFAHKDFSHLPPSPSSASINQFLRNSGSIHNFSSPTGPSAGQASYFGVPSSASKTSLQRSDSGRIRASKGAFEGQDAGMDAAEALRKLDGLGNTTSKSRPKGKQSTGAYSTLSRPATPPPSKARPTPQTDKKLPSKPSSASLRAEAGDSPLQAWIDLAADDIPAVPAIPAPNTRRRSLKGLLTGEPAPTEPPATTAPTEKRESTSSTSFVGTPTSRDSTSLPTSSTPPTSTSGIRFDKGGRRTSGGSEASAHSEISTTDVADKAERHVPPVPPLPKSYMSMRQGVSTAAQPPSAFGMIQEAPDATQDVHSPKSTISAVPSDGSAHVSVTDEHGQSSNASYANQTGSTRRPRMSKKWSFSSALNLARHSKESSGPLSSPSMWDISISEKVADTRGSQTPWTEIEHGEVSPTNFQASGSGAAETRSNQSITPVASNLPAPAPLPRSGSRRLTPSSLPFFRRTSSSSIASKLSLPRPEDVPAGPLRRPSGLSDRQVSNIMEPPIMEQPHQVSATPPQPKKSVLGMLRGSVSKRHVSNKESSVGENGEVKEPVKAASTGWAGRKRGKTLSISNDALTKSGSAAYPAPVSHNLRPKASVESSLSSRGSAQSNYSESTLNGTKKAPQSTLPAITGSPVLREPSSNASLNASASRDLPSITPTKIPRIANRPSGGSPSQHGSMPPPAMTSSKSAGQFGSLSKKTSSHSTAEPLRPSISEFGTLANSQAPRQSSSGSHRAHLLAPMSARTEGKRPEKHQREPLARLPSGQAVPPSRRVLPTAPGGSTITAPTASSLAKRASRENMSTIRPVVTRRNSKGTSSGGQTPSDQASPIKPSKSVSTKLVVPSSTSKIPSSSSLGGAPAFRKAGSLLTGSPSMSPAEDEEALADHEMQAYVLRRKARKAAGKKEDLSDINEFPEDIEPSQAITQRAFVSKNLTKLSDPERREVLDFDNIYYSPPSRISRSTGPNGAIYNHGYDDERGDYIVVEGDHLCYRYQVGSVLGKGSFGQVVQCRDHQTGSSVAVKIIRNKKRFHAQALVEVKILQQLVDWDPENKHGVLRMTDHFYFRGHLCIVTELLSINLYELIKANQFAGFSTTLIRRFAIQMLASLQLMRSHRIVHCDLKPENILLCHPIKSGIKVIDFGSSCLETEKVYTYIQSRFYRSPEVILGMSYAMAIDMWSLGCILAELFTGVPIFPGENEHEQLACIMEVLGVPERDIINRSSRRKLFFDATGAPRPFVNAKGKRRRPNTKTLAQALKCNDELFIDFIAKCLTWDPDRRLKPQPAMRHPWILAGRRRTAPTAPTGRSVSKNLDGLANGNGSGNASSSSSAIGYAGNGAGSSWSISGKEKKDKSGAGGLLISPPTPLMARTSGGSGASKVAGSGSSSRLTSAHLRNGSVNMIAAKVGLT